MIAEYNLFSPFFWNFISIAVLSALVNVKALYEVETCYLLYMVSNCLIGSFMHFLQMRQRNASISTSTISSSTLPLKLGYGCAGNGEFNLANRMRGRSGVQICIVI